MSFSRTLARSVYKQPHPGFELGLLIVFPTMMIFTLNTPLSLSLTHIIIYIYIYIYIYTYTHTYIYFTRENERDVCVCGWVVSNIPYNINLYTIIWFQIFKATGCFQVTNNNNNNNNNNNQKIKMGKKLHGHFKRQTSEISHKKTWAWLKKGNLKKESESILITAQNNAIRTNSVKAKIDKPQQNNRCRLCGDKDETINHISECSKLAQKEHKTRYNWVGKMIH